MTDVTLADLKRRLTVDDLPAVVEAAAVVANAISVGAGAMILGSMMEAELRKALHLKAGELVTIAKHPNGNGDADVP